MNDFTKGGWEIAGDGRFVYALNDLYHVSNASHIAVSPGHIPGYDSEEKQQGNALVVKTALNAATKCAEMGYDAIEALRALPYMVDSLDLMMQVVILKCGNLDKDLNPHIDKALAILKKVIAKEAP